MPGLSRDLDPEATARPLARSACSTTPSASKQPPPFAPRSARRQPTIEDGVSGVNPAARSPCAAPPPRAVARPTCTASALHRVTGEAPPPPTTCAPVAPNSDGRKLPHQTITEDAVKKASEKLAPPCPRPTPPSRPPFGAVCPPRYAPTPTYYAPQLPHASRASSLFPRPYVPASVAEAALALTQRPMPYLPEGFQAAAVLNKKSGDAAMQPQQQTHAAAEAALARTQRAVPFPPEGVQAATGLNKKNGEGQLHSCNEHLLRIREECVPNIGQPLTGCCMDILESLAAFGTKSTKEVDVIRIVLMILPKGPRSMLRHEQCSNGNGVAPGGDACIHTNTRGVIKDNGDASASAFKELCFDVGPELLMSGPITSNPWKIIWKQQPLILHDTDIVRAAKAIGCRINFVQRITDILHEHPGPVRYFRVDSSQIDNGSEQLQEWFELLGRKQVQEVVFVNCMWPFDMLDFPINNLDCQSLERISLCFVKISDICLNYVKNLTMINLCCCSISSQDLYALAYQCKHLKELSIGFYEGDVIRVNSESLEILRIWNCMVRKVAVQNAAKLHRVSVATRPKKPSLHVGIWIEDAPVLKDAWFNLSVQSISICNLIAKTDNAPLPNLRRLVLHITFKVEKENEALLNLMKSSMTLRELILWRNDDVYRYECLDALVDDWSEKFKGLPCLKLHLQVFMIKDYKGGDIELAISSCPGACLQSAEVNLGSQFFSG